MSPSLRRAIKLREWCRVACDQEAPDMMRVIELNRRADEAYLKLTPEECSAYSDWAWGTTDPEEKRRLVEKFWKELLAEMPKEAT